MYLLILFLRERERENGEMRGGGKGVAVDHLSEVMNGMNDRGVMGVTPARTQLISKREKRDKKRGIERQLVSEHPLV